MPLLLSVLFFAALTFTFAAIASKGKDRRYLSQTLALGWMGLLPLLIIMNAWLPFSGGGDDESYYVLGAAPIYSMRDIFDMTRFIGLIEQPGYPWLLSIVNHFTGQDLFAFKLVNLTLFFLLVIVWYRIGCYLESSHFGRGAAVVVLLLTPMWFYVFILRKDMGITLLQSLFLLGLVGQLRSGSLRHWLLMGGSTVALIPFRSHLALMNIAVLLGTLLVVEFRSMRFSGMKVLMLIGGVFVSLTILFLGSNPEWMYGLGIYTRPRILLSNEMVEAVSEIGERSEMKRVLFPLLYILSETTGFNPQTWTQLDASWLRGVLAIPWIVIVIPFFLLGLVSLIRTRTTQLNSRKMAWGLRSSKLIGTPWCALLLFVFAYVAVSWKVGDTTRWRIPDMPVIATIGLAGWSYAKARTKGLMMVFWVTGSVSLFGFFYLLRGF